MMAEKLQRRLWVGLKSAFVAAMLLLFIVALLLVWRGERPNTRRAATGLVVLPMFSVFYVVRFSRIQLSLWSVISHFTAIACLVFIASCIFLHNTDPPRIDAASTPYLPLICAAILTFAISVGAVAHFAGYKLLHKRDRG